MTCAMCFCLNGRISRCVPQPGCNPFPNATTTTTPAPGAGGPPVVIPGPEAPILNPGGVPPAPVIANGTDPQPQPPAQPQPPPQPNPDAVIPPANASSTTAKPAGVPARFRHAKLDRNMQPLGSDNLQI